MLWLLYLQRKITWCPLDRRLGGCQSWPGHGDEEKNFQAFLRLKHLIIQPVAQCCTTELS